jgi:hypothetical protein
MGQLKCVKKSMAGIVVATAPALMLAVGPGTAAAAPPNGSNPGGATQVPVSRTLRRCDFSNDTHVSPAGTGSGMAFISSTGSTVNADVHLTIARPDTRYIVRLIQVPRPTLTCGVGDPGTAFGAIDTDVAGNGDVSIQDNVIRGATGAWVFIFAGPPDDMDFYTSDVMAAI